MQQEYFNPKLENFEIVNIKPKKFKTKMQGTSLLAYSEVLEKLGEKQREVFRVIRELKSCNAKMIARKLGWEINCVTGRINELHYDFGIIYQHKIDICPITLKEKGIMRKTIFYKPRNWEL